MGNDLRNADNGAEHIPPEIYDIAVGWDPQPEINRLLFLARQTGMDPHSALELGCGTGRLLAGLTNTLGDLHGIELDPAMADRARERVAAEIHVGDMSDFALSRGFDLIFASANTIRYVTSDAAIERLWKCIGAHLVAGGVFIADLELGFAEEAEKLHKPAQWMCSRGETTVHARWEVVEPPSPATRCCAVEYAFECREGPLRGRWSDRFPMRTYDAVEFIEQACCDGGLKLCGVYENRDPHLIETAPEKAAGRFLVVLRRNACD